MFILIFNFQKTVVLNQRDKLSHFKEARDPSSKNNVEIVNHNLQKNIHFILEQLHNITIITRI